MSGDGARLRHGLRLVSINRCKVDIISGTPWGTHGQALVLCDLNGINLKLTTTLLNLSVPSERKMAECYSTLPLGLSLLVSSHRLCTAQTPPSQHGGSRFTLPACKKSTSKLKIAVLIHAP